MKTVKIVLTVILLFTICLGLLACGKTNIQTGSAAIAHLQKHITDHSEWNDIAYKLDKSFTYTDKGTFASSSYATLNGDTWLVVLHGTFSGAAFSYVAEVKTDGTVNRLFIQAGHVTNVYYD